VWTRQAIIERKRIIEADPSLGLRWSVVESVPVHETIKLGEDAALPYYEAYRQTLRNLGEAGIDTVCYNLCECWTGHAPSFASRCRAARPHCALQRR
jgi:mannonate dehydratase